MDVPPCWDCGRPAPPRVVAAFACSACHARNPYAPPPEPRARQEWTAPVLPLILR